MPDFTLIGVTGAFVYADGSVPGGDSYVDFLLTAPLVNTATGVEVAAATRTAQLAPDGTFALPLEATTDPTTAPVGAAYLVTERIAGTAPHRTYYITLPADAPGGTVALGLLVPGTTAPPVTYALQAVTVPPPLTVALAAGIAGITWDPALGTVSDVLQRTTTGAAWTPLGTLGGDKSYIHTQGVAATTWIVGHALHKYPSVSVVDSAGTQVWGTLVYDSADQCTLSFAVPFSGTAYCN